MLYTQRLRPHAEAMDAPASRPRRLRVWL